jgi:hypothetical protein
MYKIALMIFIAFFGIFFNNAYAISECAPNDIECVNKAVEQNSSVKFYKSETDNSQTIEKSEIYIFNSTNNQLSYINSNEGQVTIVDIKAIKKHPENSIFKSLILKCPLLKEQNNIKRLSGKVAQCNFQSKLKNELDLEKQFVQDGLSTDFRCGGTLIEELIQICKIDNPNWTIEPPVKRVVKKPVIYLYPKKNEIVNVKLKIDGTIIKAIPEYKNGWSFYVNTKGLINKKYNYLFYEASLNNLEISKEGWIVKYSNLSSFFDSTMRKIGFNKNEIIQFKTYWLKNLPKASYYEIRLLTNKFISQNMALDITPKPNTLIRAIFYFKPINQTIVIKEPNIITPKRKGFVVVEWGGLIENNKIYSLR